MRIYSMIVVGLLLIVPTTLQAGYTGFEDLTAGTSYASGSLITSEDLTFEVIPFNGSPSDAFVGNSGWAGGSGNDLFLGNQVGVEFDLPSEVVGISFQYGGFCCRSGIVVNGVASPLATGLSGLDGTTIDGVSIAVSSTPTTGGEIGMINLSGEINTFAVGGAEFGIDDVRVNVPEPSAALLLVLGTLVPLCARCGGRRG